jgi:hypothetical protein
VIGGAAAALFAPFRRALHQLRLRLFPVRDPWVRLPYEAPLGMFGDGARNGFHWVFEGESRVTVSTLDEVIDWLAECRYEADASLFHEADYWQHPRTFEQLRRGDCEDFALWAWRKLVELRIDADLVIGRRVPPGAENSRHAWIVFRDGNDEFVFEPVIQDRATAVRRVTTVRTEYIPEFGVTSDKRRFYFAGYAYFLQNRGLGRTRASSGSGVGAPRSLSAPPS